jgi:hypothetical protein
MKNKKTKTDGQRSKVCDINGCQNKGRILAKLGGIEIAYCPEHRKKYGERIINALINSCFNFKLTNFLTEIKTEIFMGDNIFCMECNQKLKDYIIEKTEELENMLIYAEENDAKIAEDEVD